jgi:cell division protein ZapA (FtsZ GTPase activity inhibitor)
MQDLSLQIHIANRDYALKVPAADKDKANEAGNLIAARIAELKKDHGITDTQDLLVLCAFGLAGELLGQKKEHHHTAQKQLQQIHSIDALLDSHLQSFIDK